MGKEIVWEKISWNENDDFIAFAFGDFDSKSFGIVRTSNGDRYNIHLSAPMNDVTADVPGSDGQYYFGTFHKPKVFDVSFAFDHLTRRQLRDLKKAFTGKEMRELCFAEEYYRIYMAKVTSQPNIKSLCFDEDGEEIYKGEGNVQFTAYWPYARDIQSSSYTGTATENGITITVENEGDIPTTFVVTAREGAKISEIVIKQDETKITTISGVDITEWNSKTGIIKSGDKPISYTGNGLVQLPLDLVDFVIKGTGTVEIEFNNWYY